MDKPKGWWWGPIAALAIGPVILVAALLMIKYDLDILFSAGLQLWIYGSLVWFIIRGVRTGDWS